MEVSAAAADRAQRCIAGGGTGQGHRLLRLGQGGRGVAHRHAPGRFRLRSGHFTTFDRAPVRLAPVAALAVSKANAVGLAGLPRRWGLDRGGWLARKRVVWGTSVSVEGT